MWSGSRQPHCPDLSVLMKLQHLGIWLLHSSSVPITKISSSSSVNVCQQWENLRVFLHRNLKPRTMWCSGLWYDGLCCPEECQMFTYLLGDLVPQLLNCSHWILLIGFILFYFLPCQNLPLAMSFKFLSEKQKPSECISDWTYFKCFCKVGVKSDESYWASGLNCNLQLHFIVSFFSSMAVSRLRLDWESTI